MSKVDLVEFDKLIQRQAVQNEAKRKVVAVVDGLLKALGDAEAELLNSGVCGADERYRLAGARVELLSISRKMELPPQSRSERNMQAVLQATGRDSDTE